MGHSLPFWLMIEGDGIDAWATCRSVVSWLWPQGKLILSPLPCSLLPQLYLPPPLWQVVFLQATCAPFIFGMQNPIQRLRPNCRVPRPWLPTNAGAQSLSVLC